jgi:hypothetical protein
MCNHLGLNWVVPSYIPHIVADTTKQAWRICNYIVLCPPKAHIAVVGPSTRRCSPRFELGSALLHPSHSCRYNQTSMADPQLYCAMSSQGSRSCGRTIHEAVFLEPSRNRNCATMCHSHTQAYLSTTSSRA